MERLSRFQFAYWLRTGRVPVEPEGAAEVKFNPNHDPNNGQFTFAGQGEQSGSATVGNFGRFTRAVSKPGTKLISDHVVQKFKERMIPQENDRNDVYPDSRGIPTVGIGHKVVPGDALKVGDRISDAQKEAFWREDSAKALEAAAQQMKEAGTSDPDFILPLADVNFQLGLGWRASFKKTWALIRAGNYEAAAREVGSSKWYKQTPKRVKAFQSALRALSTKQKQRSKTRSP